MFGKNTKFDFIALKGQIIYLDSFTKDMFKKYTNYNLNIGSIGHLNSFTFPLGASAFVPDTKSLISGEKKKITRYGVIFSKKKFFAYTLARKPLISEGKVVGIINCIDSGLEQIKHNPCFDFIQPIHYQYEKFSKNDLQVLMLLAQFPDITAQEIKKTLGVKLRTAYMYKYDLMTKLKEIFMDNDLCLTECINLLFRINPSDCGAFITLPLQEFMSHYYNIASNKIDATLTGVNNFDPVTEQYLSKLRESASSR